MFIVVFQKHKKHQLLRCHLFNLNKNIRSMCVYSVNRLPFCLKFGFVD